MAGVADKSQSSDLDAVSSATGEKRRQAWLERSSKHTVTMATVKAPPAHFERIMRSVALHRDSYVPAYALNSSQTRVSLARDGYVAIQGLISEDEVSVLRSRIETIVEDWPEKAPASCFEDTESAVTPLVDWAADKPLAPGVKKVDAVRRLFRVCKHDETFRKIGTDSRLIDPLQSIWSDGPSSAADTGVALLQSMCLLKPPGTGEKRWHADQAYFRLRPSRVFAYWIALDDTDENNGCMFVQPGSHQRGLLPHGNPTPKTHIHYSVRDPFVPPEPLPDSPATASGAAPEHPPPLPAEASGSAAAKGSLNPFGPPVAVRLKAGDALLFHGDLVHGTPPNRSADRRRRAVQLHYAWAGCVPTSCELGEEGPTQDEMLKGAVVVAPNEVSGPAGGTRGAGTGRLFPGGGESGACDSVAETKEAEASGGGGGGGGEEVAEASEEGPSAAEAVASTTPQIDGAGPLAGAGRFAVCIESQHWYYRRAELLAAGKGGGAGSLWPA